MLCTTAINTSSTIRKQTGRFLPNFFLLFSAFLTFAKRFKRIFPGVFTCTVSQSGCERQTQRARSYYRASAFGRRRVKIASSVRHTRQWVYGKLRPRRHCVCSYRQRRADVCYSDEPHHILPSSSSPVGRHARASFEILPRRLSSRCLPLYRYAVCRQWRD